MSKHFGIVNMVCVIFIAALIFGYLIYEKSEREEIERLKLSYAIDYAADAGAMAMLKTGDLNMDYSKRKYFTVDPELALDTFLEVFCFNYDLLPTPDNKAMIKDYIPVAAVAAYDGYYVAQQQLVRNGGGNYPGNDIKDADWDTVFGMKIPYAYSNNISTTKYALNMGLEYTIALTGTDMTKQEGLPPTDTGVMTPLNAKVWINDLISNKIANTINTINENNPNWKNRFYIPSQFSSRIGVNPIEGPTFMILVQNVTLSTARPISGFSISGTRIDAARMVIGYTRVGSDRTQYYAFADSVPKDTEGLEIKEMFSNVNEAAAAGYYYDPAFMNSQP
jgi:hypothetical protein